MPMANPGCLPAPGGALSAIPSGDRPSRGGRWRSATWLFGLCVLITVLAARPSGQPSIFVAGLTLSAVGALIGLVAVLRSASELRREPLVGTVGVVLLTAGCSAGGGDAATWELRAPDDVTATSRSLDIGVTRLGCASGMTGEVLEPQVVYETERIVIQVDVAPFAEEAADCQGNDVVPVTVELDEAVGDRELVDGACLDGEAVDTSFCMDATRWP